MYVVRKHPRFLRAHWKFLQTVVKKLVEFLQERHPGVQDMSIETLEELAVHTGHSFLIRMEKDPEPFIYWIILGTHGNLEPPYEPFCQRLTLTQTENLYKTWGVVIKHCQNKSKAIEILDKLLRVTNENWRKIISQCKNDAKYLLQKHVTSRVTHLIRIYKKTASTCGPSFMSQMKILYNPLLEVYNYYAKAVSRELTGRNSPKVRAMCTVKSEILKLVETFVTNSHKSDHLTIAKQFVPKFLSTVLTDYQNSKIREAACLSACSALIETLKAPMFPHVSTIFKSVYSITDKMLSAADDSTFPDHREAFAKLLLVVTRECFGVFNKMQQSKVQEIIKHIVKASGNMKESISENGLLALTALVKQISANSSICTSFYKSQGGIIMDRLISNMLDKKHKGTFHLMCDVLRIMCNDIQTPGTCISLFQGHPNLSLSPADIANENKKMVGGFLMKKLSNSFPYLTREAINHFVIGFFEISNKTKDRKVDENSKHPLLKHCEDFLAISRTVMVRSKDKKGGNTPNRVSLATISSNYDSNLNKTLLSLR